MIAVELVARVLDEQCYSNIDILIHSDNAGVVGAFNRGRNRNFQVNLSIRRTNIFNIASNTRLVLEYVNTKENIADPVSRRILGSTLSRLPSIELLSELVPFLLYE
jgi:hypothetical protein